MERVDKFTEEEYEKIKSYVRENESPRDYLLVVLGYNLPLRISHLLELKVNEVMDDDGDIKREIYIEDWEDSIPIDDHSIQALEFYFNQVEAEQTDWLFPNSRGGHINRIWVWRLVKEWAKEVDLEGHYGTDSLRKHNGVHSGSGAGDYYNINPSTFSEIDNERAGYALGLIATDGSIQVSKNILFFKTSEKELAENLRNCLKSDKKLVKENREGQSLLYIYTTSKIDIIKDILDYIPALSRDWNNISDPIKESPAVNHFVRGVLDGDGHVGRGKEYGENNVIITGKKGVLDDLKEVIVNACSIDRIDIRNKKVTEGMHGGEDTYDLYIVGRDQVKLLYKWIYDDAQYYLTRKKKAMENIIAAGKNTSEYMDKLWGN